MKARILIVEDHALNRRLLRVLLESRGHPAAIAAHRERVDEPVSAWKSGHELSVTDPPYSEGGDRLDVFSASVLAVRAPGGTPLSDGASSLFTYHT